MVIRLSPQSRRAFRASPYHTLFASPPLGRTSAGGLLVVTLWVLLGWATMAGTFGRVAGSAAPPRAVSRTLLFTAAPDTCTAAVPC